MLNRIRLEVYVVQLCHASKVAEPGWWRLSRLVGRPW